MNELTPERHDEPATPDARTPSEVGSPVPDVAGSEMTSELDDTTARLHYMSRPAHADSVDRQAADARSGSAERRPQEPEAEHVDRRAQTPRLAEAEQRRVADSDVERAVEDRSPRPDQRSDDGESVEQVPVDQSKSDRAVAIREVREALDERHPDVAGVVARLLDDEDHPLDVVERLRDPERRSTAITTIRELADERVLANRSLDEFTAEHPGRGPLFTSMPSEVNNHDDGRTRKAAYVADCKERDPARVVGPQPSDDERELVADYARRLSDEVMPQVWLEVGDLSRTVDGTRSIRAKNDAGLHDKVARMAEGAAGREARLEYQVGDVIDAVGARINVADTEQLEQLLSGIKDRFGIGDGGRILELENLYASPKAHNPSYRTVPLVVAVEVGHMPYTFELQLCTWRASIASDLEHNTVYKPYIRPTPAEQEKVRRMQAEAAALDQNETRSRWHG